MTNTKPNQHPEILIECISSAPASGAHGPLDIKNCLSSHPSLTQPSETYRVWLRPAMLQHLLSLAVIPLCWHLQNWRFSTMTETVLSLITSPGISSATLGQSCGAEAQILSMTPLFLKFPLQLNVHLGQWLHVSHSAKLQLLSMTLLILQFLWH